MSLQIINRRGYLNEWTQAEGQGKGNLRRGEIAIAIVTDDGTDTGNIVEVIGRIGPSDTPTPFSDCPVVFRSPRDFKGEFVRPVLVDDEPQVNSVLAYDSDAKKFVSLSEDPGNYEESDDDDDDDSGELSEVAPTILSAQVKNLDSQAVVGTNPKYDLEVKVIGRPDPILSIEIIETAWPDYDGNAVNFTTTTAYSFTSDNLPAGIILSVEDDPALAALGVRTYTFGRVVVNRDVPTSRVSLNARIGATNPAGEAPIVERTLQGTIKFVEDPATAAADPTLTKVAISEGGNEKSKIANLATDGTATLTANYVASDFTDGVANGTVSYQWSSNGAALVGETGSTLTLTNTADVYNDSQIKVDVTISDDNGTDTRSGYMVVGDYDEGFTELSPSADSRLIYVATDGDDAQAASNQHGRPYYLPGDPEIGPDPMNPVGPIRAFADPFEAVKYVRGCQYIGDRPDGFPDYDRNLPRTTGYPDWMLFRRGQSFDTSKDYIATNGSPRTIDVGTLVGAWDQQVGLIFGHGAYVTNTGGPRGRSESEPMVVTAWGPLSDPRPVFSGGFGVQGSHRVVASIEARGMGFGQVGGVDWIATDGEQTGLLVEDCKFTKGMGYTNFSVFKNVRIRRCVVVDSFNSGGHNQGLFVKDPWDREDSKEIGWDLVIEECVFDRNGYKQDPNEPTTWTAGASSEAAPYGQGVQPARTFFDRNLYLSSYTDLKVRGNIISRGGGGNDVQMRAGGVCERNLFLMNSQGILFGGGQTTAAYHDDGLLIDNVFLHDEPFVPPGGHTTAVEAYFYDATVVMTGNIVARYMRTSGSMHVVTFAGKPYHSDTQPESPARMIAMFDNELDLDGGKHAIRVRNMIGTDILDLIFQNNAIWKGSHLQTGFLAYRQEIVDSEFFTPESQTTGEPWEWSDNDYATAAAGFPFRLPNVDRRDLAGWQSAGFDIGSTMHPDRAALAAAAGWTDPDRSILTYMQAVDPTYAVNEDVYVDDGSSGQKQAVRQKVWETLVPNFGEATAKLIARNYHAFLAFIEKARNNRKGAWDTRWTAEAVNNYIREGYGKPALGGAYTADLADIPALVAEVSA